MTGKTGNRRPCLYVCRSWTGPSHEELKGHGSRKRVKLDVPQFGMGQREQGRFVELNGGYLSKLGCLDLNIEI